MKNAEVQFYAFSAFVVSLVGGIALVGWLG